MAKTRLGALFGAVTVVAVLGAGPAWGHARFDAKTVPADTDQALKLRVPVEKDDLVNSRVVVGVPAGFDVLSCTPAPSWSCGVEPGPGGVSMLTFGGPAVSKEVVETFVFVVHTAKEAGKQPFVVAQTYSDGQVVMWGDGPNAEEPAPVLTVSAAPVREASAAPAPEAAPAPALPAPAPAPEAKAKIEPVSMALPEPQHATAHAAPAPVVAAAAAQAEATAAAPTLPRTGPSQAPVVVAGLALAAGGLAVVGGARRRTAGPVL